MPPPSNNKPHNNTSPFGIFIGKLFSVVCQAFDRQCAVRLYRIFAVERCVVNSGNLRRKALERRLSPLAIVYGHAHAPGNQPAKPAFRGPARPFNATASGYSASKPRKLARRRCRRVAGPPTSCSYFRTVL